MKNQIETQNEVQKEMHQEAQKDAHQEVHQEVQKDAHQEMHKEHSHTHILEDGTVIEHTHMHTDQTKEEHTHMHGHGHGHVHTHENTKAVLNRLSRVIGHLQSIKRMVEDGRDCSEVLIQLSAVKAAINSTGKVILQDHIEHCLVDAIETGDRDAIEELNKAIDRFIK